MFMSGHCFDLKESEVLNMLISWHAKLSHVYMDGFTKLFFDRLRLSK